MLDAYLPLPSNRITDDPVTQFSRRKLGVNQQRGDFTDVNMINSFEGSKVQVILQTGDNRRKSKTETYHQQQTAWTKFQSKNLEFSVTFSQVSLPVQSLVDFGITSSYSEVGTWLPESLEQLSECPAIAQEEEMAEPTNLALAKAKTILRELATHMISQPDVYPMQYSSIAIDFRGPSSNSGVLFVIDDDGSGVFFHQTNHSKGRLRVNDANDLLKEGGMRELERIGVR